MEIEITAANFKKEVSEAENPVLVNFTADWCREARKLGPTVSKFAADHPEITVGKVDVDRSYELAERFGIKSVPSFLLFKEGQLAVFSAGNQTEETLVSMISEGFDA